MTASRFSFLRSSVFALSGIVVSIVVIGIVAAVLIARVQGDIVRLYHARVHLQQVYSSMLDQETAVRGYVATGRLIFLNPYADGTAQIRDIFPLFDRDAAIGGFTNDTRDMRALHIRWLREVAQPLVAMPHRPDAVQLEIHGKYLMDAIRLRAIDVREHIDAHVDADMRDSSFILFSALALALLLVLGFGYMGLRFERARYTRLKALQDDIAARNIELERSNASLQEFAYVASHDLQEPLRAVARFTQLLKRRYADRLDSEANGFITLAADEAVRMQALIHDILEYSRVTTHGKEFEPVNLSVPVAQALATLKSLVDESKSLVSVATMPTVRGDAVQLAQLFQNLIANAVKYNTSPVPHVRISAERIGAEWVISVSDNGIGVSENDRDRIFQVFQRLHTREEYEGTGIGLAIAKRILERHGGRIWVEAGEQGTGATFKFTLPVDQGAPN